MLSDLGAAILGDEGNFAQNQGTFVRGGMRLGFVHVALTESAPPFGVATDAAIFRL